MKAPIDLDKALAFSRVSDGMVTSETLGTRGTLKQPPVADRNDASTLLVLIAEEANSLFDSSPAPFGPEVNGKECCLGGSEYCGRPWAVIVAHEEA